MLGGYREVAETLGLVPNTVNQWKCRNRIPPMHWPAIERMARKQGLAITVHDLLRGLDIPSWAA